MNCSSTVLTVYKGKAHTTEESDPPLAIEKAFFKRRHLSLAFKDKKKLISQKGKPKK